MIEILKFSDTLSIWKTEFDLNDISNVVQICKNHINNHPESKKDVYGYYGGILELNGRFNRKIENELDNILNFSMNSVISLYNKPYNILSTDVWINVVRAGKPKQDIFNSLGQINFHRHTELNEIVGKPIPNYTFVSYIQIPNNLSGDDGVLFLKDEDNEIHKYLPKVGECLIMDADIPHVPNMAENSNIDRIVLAGNVRFEMIKKQKTML